jgi:protease I
MRLKKFFLPAVIMAALIMLVSCQPKGQEQDKAKDKDKKETKQAKIAVLVDEGFQDAEAYMPIGYFTNLGAYVKVIGPEKGKVKAYNSDFTIKIQKAIEDAKVDYFDALIIPGGKAPSKLRENKKVVSFTKEFFNSGKPVASICHGPQILVTAGVLDGRKSAGYEGIKKEVEEAGAKYVNDSLVVDDNYISSRVPKDLPYFCNALEKALKEKDLLQD